MKKICSLLLILALLCSLPLLYGCKEDPATVRVWTLNGTTGFGMAQLMDKASKGETENSYDFTVEAKATTVRDALISGDADIGALPTNVAAQLYNSTDKEVVLLALNTRGVLYLVANTANVSAPTSLADLAGKTVYCPAENPTLITKALLEKADVSLTLDNTSYAEPAALRDALAAGLVDYAVLPEPMVTIAKSKAATGVTLTSALDLTAEWDQHFAEGSLVQGCVVARKAFVEEHPDLVESFLADYAASIRYITENPAEGGELIAAAEIFAQAKVAERAIPKCNLCFVTGEPMKEAMEVFLAAMPKAAIGGELPADDFYYGLQ